MTTEVQLGNNRLHLQYLRRVVSVMSAGLGMPRRDTEDIHRAIAEVCVSSMKSSETDSVSVSLTPCGTYFMAEITNRSVDLSAFAEEQRQYSEIYSRTIEGIMHLVDTVEVLHREDGVAVRLIKYVKKMEVAAGAAVPGVMALGLGGVKP